MVRKIERKKDNKCTFRKVARYVNRHIGINP